MLHSFSWGAGSLKWTGLTIDRWTVDALHTWALGPLGTLVAFVFHVLLATGLFRPASAFIDTEDANKLALMSIRALLMQYYRENPDVGTKVNSVTIV